MKKKYIVRLTASERASLDEVVKRLSGFGSALESLPRAPRTKLLDGDQEAEIIALRLGAPPAGFAKWSLRLLAERVVALEIAPAIGHETVRCTLKKTA